MCLDVGNETGGQGNGSSIGLGLGRTDELTTAPKILSLPMDVDGAVQQVDVPASECEQFATAQTGEGCHEHQAAKPRVDCVSERVHLNDRRWMALLTRLHPSSLHVAGVGGQEAVLHGRVKDLDWWVEDLEAGVAWAIDCGAVEASSQPTDRDLLRHRIMLDPTGHPFCLS